MPPLSPRRSSGARRLGWSLLAACGGCAVLHRAAGQAIYISDGGTDSKIIKANLDGTNATVLVQGEANSMFRGLATDGRHLLWCEQGQNRIMKRRFTDGIVETLLNWTAPEAIAISTTTRKMYWTDVVGSLQRASIVGTEIAELRAPSYHHLEGLAIDTSRSSMFWTRAALHTGTIEKSDMTGSSVSIIASTDNLTFPYMEMPLGVAVHSSTGDVFFSDVVTDKIYRASADGTSVVVIASQSLHSPIGLAIDEANGKLYWVDRGVSRMHDASDAVWRSNLDGSDAQVILNSSLLAEPRGIVVV